MPTTQPRGGQIADGTIKLDTPNQDVVGTLPVGNGGTGSVTLTLNAVLLGNGTGGFQVVIPGANGTVLTSNGTTWAAAAPAGGGTTALIDGGGPTGTPAGSLVIDFGGVV